MNSDGPTVLPSTKLSPGTKPKVDANGVPWFEGSVDTWEEAEEAESVVKAPPRPPPPLPPKRRLKDEGEIARGGMGSIRRLYDTDLQRHIAMKVLDPMLVAAREDARDRFLDEARITGQLGHPNIVPVHDLTVDKDGTPQSFTMKLVEGQTLTKMIGAQRTQADLERLLETLIKVCEALSFAHSKNIIHRDLKPDNIMVGSHGEVYVMDWGCAQLVGASSGKASFIEPEGTIIGTAQYMAPEQAWGRISEIDQRTDVFAVGGILYKMLTGSPPYPGKFEAAVRLAQAGQPRPPAECTGVTIKPPPDLSRIAMKAMSKDPAERYQTVEDLAQDLRAFLRGGNWFALHTFRAGDVIVHEGARAEAAYIITAGTCEVRKRDPNDPNKSITLRTLHAGQVFGETAIFADAPRSASVVALEDVSTVVVERQALEGMLQSSWLGQFVKALADRFLEHDVLLSKLKSAAGHAR